MQNKADTVTIISSYSPLLKTGKIYRGYCPFCHSHEDKLVVKSEIDEWHCFSCGLGGNVYDFFSQIEGVTIEHAKDLLNRAFSDEHPASHLSSLGRVPDIISEGITGNNVADESMASASSSDQHYYTRLRSINGYIAADILDSDHELISQDPVDFSDIPIKSRVRCTEPPLLLRCGRETN